MTCPKIFISYSWTSQDHIAWVISHAAELVKNGIDVKLDQWDLLPGHDAFAFMESMISDPTVTKVLLICDKKYAEKSNTRIGGAGAEAQIISPELYSKMTQDKFVAIVRERDENGTPYVPVYYKSRIFIDLSDASTYAGEFEKLLRWAWDKPLNVKPKIGSQPKFLEENNDVVTSETTMPFRTAIDAIKSDKSNAISSINELFNSVISTLHGFRIVFTGNDFDERVVESISKFTPLRDQIIEIFLQVAMRKHDEEMLDAIHHLFESMIQFHYPPNGISSWNNSEFDNFKFIINELFLFCVGSFLRYGKFSSVEYIISKEFYFSSNYSNSVMFSYTIFQENIHSLNYRNQRLKSNRVSLHADMLKERAISSGIDFSQIMLADFILYFRSLDNENSHRWWPESLLWMSTRFGRPFEIFARAKSEKYFDKIKCLVNVKNKFELIEKIDKIYERRELIPSWQFDRLDIRALMQLEHISTTT